MTVYYKLGNGLGYGEFLQDNAVEISEDKYDRELAKMKKKAQTIFADAQTEITAQREEMAAKKAAVLQRIGVTEEELDLFL